MSQPVTYATQEERLRALEEDNAVLRCMLQRRSAAPGSEAPVASAPASGGTSPAPGTHPGSGGGFTAHRQQKTIDKLTEDLRVEREQRLGIQASMVAQKDKHDLLMRQKEHEVRRITEMLLTLRTDVEEYEKKSKSDTALIESLRSELVKAQRQNKVDHAREDNNKAVTARKLHKPFSQVLRQISLELGGNSGPAPVPVTPTKGGNATAQTRRSASSESGNHHNGGPSISPSVTRNAATKTPNRTQSPSDSVRGRRGQDVKVGDKVTWSGLDATVRYIGVVHCLGEAQWVGLELAAAGKGDHNGTLSCVRYFTCPPKQGIFCSPAEVSFPKPKTMTYPPSPSSARGRSAKGGAPVEPVSPPATAGRATPTRRPGTSPLRAVKPAQSSPKSEAAPSTANEAAAAATEEQPVEEHKPTEPAPVQEPVKAAQEPAAEEAAPAVKEPPTETAATGAEETPAAEPTKETVAESSTAAPEEATHPACDEAAAPVTEPAVVPVAEGTTADAPAAPSTDAAEGEAAAPAA